MFGESFVATICDAYSSIIGRETTCKNSPPSMRDYPNKLLATTTQHESDIHDGVDAGCLMYIAAYGRT